jgi:hypothetical protein
MVLVSWTGDLREGVRKKNIREGEEGDEEGGGEEEEVMGGAGEADWAVLMSQCAWWQRAELGAVAWGCWTK